MKTIKEIFKKYIDYIKIKRSMLFDEKFYFDNYHDLDPKRINPILHFIQYGANEYRSPSALFDLPRYLLDNPQVVKSGANPLVDWIEFSGTGKRISPKAISNSDFSMKIDFRTRQRCELIRESGLFCYEYYISSYFENIKECNNNKSIENDFLLHYVQFGAAENRNPSTEFDTHFYSVEYGHLFLDDDGPAAALTHYILSGRKNGLLARPNKSITIIQGGSDLINLNSRLAIHIHLYYIEYTHEIISFIRRQRAEFDIYVSTTNYSNSLLIEYFLKEKMPDKRIFVYTVENRGRDIAPFIAFLNFAQDRYDFVCHLHSKKSPHTDFGKEWFWWLMTNLFGSPSDVETFIQFMEENPTCGMLFPDNFFEIKKSAGWSGNEGRISAILSRVGLKSPVFPRFAQFPAGSMGWYRTKAFSDLLMVPFVPDDFETEEGQEEGTLAHAFERAFPFIASNAGYDIIRFYRNVKPES